MKMFEWLFKERSTVPLTDRDREVMSTCKWNSLIYYCIPIGGTTTALIYMLSRRGKLHRPWNGYILYYLLGGLGSFFGGKLLYMPTCLKMFAELDTVAGRGAKEALNKKRFGFYDLDDEGDDEEILPGIRHRKRSNDPNDINNFLKLRPDKS